MWEGLAQQGFAEFGEVPPDSLLSANLGRQGGVRPSTVRDMIQDCHWRWGPVTGGTAGASLIPRDPKGLADLQVWTTQGEGRRGSGPCSHYLPGQRP